jgi:outer membrane lipoprotein SlyB
LANTSSTGPGTAILFRAFFFVFDSAQIPACEASHNGRVVAALYFVIAGQPRGTTMSTMTRFGPALALAAAMALSACASMNQQPSSASSPAVSRPASVSSGYGIVQSIDVVKADGGGIGGSGLGAGTIAGAVIGGVLGHQVGQGTGNTAATVAGAAGGAYVGHQMEKQSLQTADAYRFTIRMENGSYQTLMLSANADFRVGDRVRIDNGVMQRY